MNHTLIQRSGLAAVGASTVALLFANVIGNRPGENGSETLYVVSVAICVAAAVVLFARLIPAAVAAGAHSAGRRALVLGILALVAALPAFWSGLGFIMGAAAAALGTTARQRGAGAGATVAIVLGLLAVAANTGIIVMDELG